MTHQPSILVTFDSMKNANSGYFYFGKGLGNGLINNNHDRFHLEFYLHQRTAYRFDDKVDILQLSKWHQLYFPNRNKYDLVHITDDMCRLNPAWVNAKKIMTIHDMNRVHVETSTPEEIEKYLQKLRKNIEQVDHIVAISQFVANDIQHYFPQTKDKVTVIYNGADALTVPDGYKPVVAPTKPFLFTIGLLSRQKNFHLLPALLQDNELELVIAGIETPHVNVIIAEAKKFGCLDRLHITGPVSDEAKAWYYQNCTAFLFPSRTEGFGLPVIEAMHFGKPVFLSKYTSLPEVGGDVAYYFDSLEPAAMQQTFKNGMDDFLSRNLSWEIKQQAMKFSWDRAAQQYLQLYEQILSK
ncbi:glycosyltransferase family 4 protein [Mucilaginibacter jinjuensis]|uniref:Glycosyltransferase family 1 protein n=1 Tax=Mucilaginibacter jinjuensis TaxID=1176721 RepID=A0ABY7T989_9SPHI|nr:glycosyltransferase family 1 protein [Mucilaginibacter jinjuensis]WCT12685.1 glycosyltransferase family 1 protein [Mucilaginibacter jinjuensis]